MTRLAVITGSVRPNRVGSAVAQWVAERASTVEGAEAEVLELADFRLPVFAEEIPPMMAAPKDPAAVAWNEALDSRKPVVFLKALQNSLFEESEDQPLFSTFLSSLYLSLLSDDDTIQFSLKAKVKTQGSDKPKPEKPNKPRPNPQKPEGHNPKTGDATGLEVYLMLLSMAVVGGGMVAARRKENDK